MILSRKYTNPNTEKEPIAKVKQDDFSKITEQIALEDFMRGFESGGSWYLERKDMPNKLVFCIEEITLERLPSSEKDLSFGDVLNAKNFTRAQQMAKQHGQWSMSMSDSVPCVSSEKCLDIEAYSNNEGYFKVGEVAELCTVSIGTPKLGKDIDLKGYLPKHSRALCVESRVYKIQDKSLVEKAIECSDTVKFMNCHEALEKFDKAKLEKVFKDQYLEKMLDDKLMIEVPILGRDWSHMDRSELKKYGYRDLKKMLWFKFLQDGLYLDWKGIL